MGPGKQKIRVMGGSRPRRPAAVRRRYVRRLAPGSRAARRGHAAGKEFFIYVLFITVYTVATVLERGDSRCIAWAWPRARAPWLLLAL